MKALLTLLLLFLALFQTTQGQVIIDNFESNRIAQYGYRDGTYSTVTNPVQSGINTTGQVGMYIRNGAAQYDVMRIQVPGYFNDVTAYTTGARTLRLKVLSPAVGIPVQLSFEDTNRTTPSNYPTGRYCVVFATTTRANQWEELVFTSPIIPDGGTSPLGINVLLLSFNINSFTSGTYYFDDVQVPDYTTFSLVWSDEFTGTTLNRNNWNVEVNDFGGGNNELQYYTDRPDNIQITGGQLNLIAKRENYGTRQYTSGRINSSGLAGVLYGRISVRARIPVGQGIWPAAWMLPTDWAYGGWPNSGEIDIMEALGHEPNKVYGTIHYANPNYTYNSRSYTKPSGNFSDGFHVYEVAWTPTRINFLVDSVQIHSIPFQGRPFDRRFHMVLNLAVGGNWPGSPNGTTVFPATYSIDYVRMYGSQFLCNAPATPTITNSGSANFCEGSSRTLTSNVGDGYLWNTGETTRSITTTIGGSYSVRLIRGNCTSAASTAVVLTVSPVPNQPTITYSGSTTFCAGNSLVLNAPAGFNYLWSNNATTQNITVTQSGNYSVRIISGTCTSEASNEVSVIVTLLPATPTISGATSFCVGSSTTLTSNAISGNLWSNGDTTQSISVSNAGNYSVRTIEGTCTSASSSSTSVSSIICNQIFTGDASFTNANNWNSGSVPVSGSDITVRGRMSLYSSISLRNIVIDNGAVISIPSGVQLSITGNLSNQGTIFGEGNVRLAGPNNQNFEGGTINNLFVDNGATVIQNGATQISGSLILGNNQVLNLNNNALTLLSTAIHTAQLAQVHASSSITNANNFTIQRWLNSSLVRRGAISIGNYYFLGPVVQGQTMNLWNNVSTYNNQTFSGLGTGNLYLYNPSSNNWSKPSSAATSLPVGAGVQVWFGVNNFFNSRNEWSATGAPQVGDYNLPFTAQRGFHLLSNPYPSTIDWDSPNWTKTNVYNAIYIYDWVNRRYKTYIAGVGANGGNRYLSTAQGFLVWAENSSPILTAREGIKVSNQVALQRIESQVNSLIRLQVSRGSMSDEVVIANRPNTQLAFEPQVDAQKLMNPATNIYVNGTIRQSIASMNLNATNTIPIQLLSDSTGIVTISTTEFSGLSGGTHYLVDEVTTEAFPYTPQTTYQFYMNANEPYSLSLRLNNVNSVSQFKSTQFEVFPNPATDKITIKTTSKGTLEILNTLGQVVITQMATGTNEINITKLAKGVYSVRFNGVSQKLVVK